MSTIQTFTGRYIDLLAPKQDDFRLVDIAHSLSLVNRFAGHTVHPYSVAQHSVLCARLVPPEFELEALFHDAQEAYIGDVSTPLKALLPEYRRIEDQIESCLRGKLCLTDIKAPEVKRADLIMLATEHRDLMPQDHSYWPHLEGIDPAAKYIDRWSPEEAAAEFIRMALKLIPDHLINRWMD